MNSKSDDDAALRAVIRREVDRTSAREVSQRAGVSHETVYALLRGAKIAERSRVRLSALTEGPAPSVAGAASQPAPPVGAHAPSYWQGELNASLRSLRAIQDLAGAVAATIQGTLASGVLAGAAPAPRSNPIEAWNALSDEEKAALAAKQQREEAAVAAEEARAEQAARKRAAGGR